MPIDTGTPDELAGDEPKLPIEPTLHVSGQVATHASRRECGSTLEVPRRQYSQWNRRVCLGDLRALYARHPGKRSQQRVGTVCTNCGAVAIDLDHAALQPTRRVY